MEVSSEVRASRWYAASVGPLGIGAHREGWLFPRAAPFIRAVRLRRAARPAHAMIEPAPAASKE